MFIPTGLFVVRSVEVEYPTEKPKWGDWQDWTVCSKKCGGGISYRKRKCIPSKCPYADPTYNKCDGTDYEEKKCNEKCCPGLLAKHLH